MLLRNFAEKYTSARERRSKTKPCHKATYADIFNRPTTDFERREKDLIARFRVGSNSLTAKAAQRNFIKKGTLFSATPAN
jgi:hypothetical protein